MVKMIIWDKNSTNFDANKFVRENGTEQIEFPTKEDAVKHAWEISQTEKSFKYTIENEDGTRLSGAQLLCLTMEMIDKKQLS